MARVAVAMSGGVDSSVAAVLLVEQGHEVIGVMSRPWPEPAMQAGAPGSGHAVGAPSAPLEDAGGAIRRRSAEAVADARAVADRLGIPLHVIDATAPFEQGVVDPFVARYAAGLTPNPCLDCNRTMRFGHLLETAQALGARHLATGHYARVRRNDDGRYELRRGADRAKDQSYVLSRLGQAELAAALFPLGEHTKHHVRSLAAARGLTTAARPESQDLCFVADGDYRRFVAGRAPEAARPGPILDVDGRQLGVHRGLSAYTVGQRSGLGIGAARPLYVLDLDVGRNTLTVGPAERLERRRIRVGAVNWIAGQPPGGPIQVEVQVRYHARPVAAVVRPTSEGGADVALAEPVRDAAPGQAAVFYRGELCLGGGAIERLQVRDAEPLD